MPSRKQRRRRAKERRHEYEYVYVDEEGEELDPEEAEVAGPPARKERPKPADGKSAAKQPRSTSGAAVRTVPAPSWRRVGKRAGIFAPFMFVAIWLLGRGRLSTTSIVFETFWLIVLFVPFSYAIDRMAYRRYLKQTGQAPPPQRQRRA